MNQRLTQNQRSLLSAYFDREASDPEKMQAEELIASSDEARRYIEELRALDGLSADLLVPVAAVTARVATSAKLTGSAIETMARGTSALKGIGGLGSWGIAALGGTAVMIAVGVTLSLRSPSEPPDRSARYTVSGDNRGTTSRPASPDVVRAISIDTSALIIPPMTDGEIISFALDGTLPIDSDRDRYLKFSQTEGNRLSMEVHTTESQAVPSEYASITLPDAPAIDSIRGAIRASLLKRTEGIALRADVYQLRLRTLHGLEMLAPQLPPQLCRQINTCVQVVRQGPDRPAFNPESLERYVDLAQENHYVLISTSKISARSL